MPFRQFSYFKILFHSGRNIKVQFIIFITFIIVIQTNVLRQREGQDVKDSPWRLVILGVVVVVGLRTEAEDETLKFCRLKAHSDLRNSHVNLLSKIENSLTAHILGVR